VPIKRRCIKLRHKRKRRTAFLPFPPLNPPNPDHTIITSSEFTKDFTALSDPSNAVWAVRTTSHQDGLASAYHG